MNRMGTAKMEMEPDQQISSSRSGDGNFDAGNGRLYSLDVRNMWNLVKVFRELGTREQGVAFAEQNELVLARKICSTHKKPMTIKLTINNTVGVFLCHKGACRNKTVSRTKGTCFANTKLQLPQIYYLTYCFANHWKFDQVILEDFVNNKHCLSTATITCWYNYFREIVVLYQLEHLDNAGKVGGPGKVVQVDISKFGKRKYDKGKYIEGLWVLGLIEEGSEDLRLELCPDNIRTAEVLVPLISKHVMEGTTIHTDCLEANDHLADYGFILRNTKCDPNNPLAKVETNSLQSQWRVVKQYFNNHIHQTDFGDLVVEYTWRRAVLKNKLDPFMELIKAIKHIYNPK